MHMPIRTKEKIKNPRLPSLFLCFTNEILFFFFNALKKFNASFLQKGCKFQVAKDQQSGK